MKALVVGSAGQLGRALVAELGAAVIWAGDREELDVTDAAAVARLVEAQRPDVVYNATAYNAVDTAEDAPAAALAVNALAPRHLARVCRDTGALLVHVSTDYVFDGTARTPYREGDAPHPVNAYGVSKLAGELLVRAGGAEHLVVRTSAVIGLGGSPAKGGSFVERIVEKARRGERLRVVDDQVFSPTYAPDLACALIALARAGATGLFHVTNAGTCSWHGLAVQALALARLEAPVERIRAADLALPARRPSYSVLSNERYLSLGLPAPRPWQEALAAMLR